MKEPFAKSNHRKVATIFVVALLATFFAIVIVISATGKIYEVIPMFDSETELLSVLHGTWTQQKLKLDQEELIFSRNNCKCLHKYSGDRKATMIFSGEISITDYRKGLFVVNTLQETVEYQFIKSNDSLKDISHKYTYTRSDNSQLITSVYTEEEVSQKAEVDAKYQFPKEYWDGTNMFSDNNHNGFISDSDELTAEQKDFFFYIAKEEVKNKLKSPSTAKFPLTANSSGVTITKSKDIVTVTGYVDAENSFNATIRSSFVVKIGFIDDDKYYIESCAID